MRRARVLGICLAVFIGLVGAVSTANAGGPPEGRVTVIGPVADVVDCNGVSINRTISGWVGVPSAADVPIFYHLTRVYTNAAGQQWIYVDTGLVRAFERDGVLWVSLAGRSVNVGPNDTGWVGHWELNTQTGEVMRVGLAVGDVDQLACSVLAPG